MAESEVLRKVLWVVGGTHELIRLPQAVPFLARKVEVAAARDVIVHRDNVDRRGVGGGVAVRIVLEPIHETCALRDFVRNLAVVALELGDELEGGASGGKVADGVERERCPEGIAAEEPGKPGTLAGARRSVPGDQASAEVGIGDQSLDSADARPVVSLLELRVRKSDVERAVEIVTVVLGGISQQVGIRSCQALIVGLRVSESLGGGGK